MPLLKEATAHSFDPETLAQITAVFEAARTALKVQNADPIALTLARKIIELASTGERDPQRLCALALASCSGSVDGTAVKHDAGPSSAPNEFA